MSRTMSISLIANAVLVSLVPMTYTINSRLPFAIGTLAYLTLFGVTLFMHDLPVVKTVSEFSVTQFAKIVGKRNILLFGLTFGIVSALYSSSTDMLFVAMNTYGIKPELLGWVFGISSVLGAAIGPFVHYLRQIKLGWYLTLDVGILLAIYAAAYIQNAYLLAFIIIIAVSLWRYRKIIYQSYLLKIFPTKYKATLVSSMNNLEQLNSIWLPLFIAYLIGLTSLPTGFGLMFLFTIAIFPFFYLSALKFFARATPIDHNLAKIQDTVV